jgi:hypothetical protein
MNVVLNFVLFQAGWFACVLGAANGMPWVGPVVVGLVAGFHLALVPDARAEGGLLLAAALIGALFDSLLVSTGWLGYPNGQLLPGTAPYWLVAMWVAFAMTLNVSLDWLKRSKPLAIVFGAVGGPLAFIAGEKLGGVTFNDPVAALIALSVGWALLTPLLLGLARRLDGWRCGVGGRVLATGA